MTGCSGDVLKMRKMTGAKKELELLKVLIGQKNIKDIVVHCQLLHVGDQCTFKVIHHHAVLSKTQTMMFVESAQRHSNTAVSFFVFFRVQFEPAGHSPSKDGRK